MKNVCVQFSLAALLLAAVVAVVGNGAMAPGAPNARAAVETPKLVADSLPTPWPKRPEMISETPKLVADSLPTPWPKRPEMISETPKLVADSLPVPWPKRPGSARVIES